MTMHYPVLALHPLPTRHSSHVVSTAWLNLIKGS